MDWEEVIRQQTKKNVRLFEPLFYYISVSYDGLISYKEEWSGASPLYSVTHKYRTRRHICGLTGEVYVDAGTYIRHDLQTSILNPRK